MPMNNDDDEQAAMSLVVDDMGKAAKSARLGKYAGKGKLGEENQPVAPQDTGEDSMPRDPEDPSSMPSTEELERLLTRG